MKFVFTALDPAAVTVMGGKAAALAALQNDGLPVPPWFVVAPAALKESLPAAMARELSSCRPEQVQEILARLEPAAAVGEAVGQALAGLCPTGGHVAVRSSAVDEDGHNHSFAGQLASFLFVEQQQVPARIADVWRSGYSSRVLAYRQERGLSADFEPPAVLVQRMVKADISGVAFSVDPVSGRRGVAVVSSLPGLGTALVSGECDADTWRVDRSGKIVERSIAHKSLMHVPCPGDGEGVRTVAVPADRIDVPSLTDAQVRSVAELAREAARHFGCPQDIEWVLQDGRLYLLQSRSITSLAALPDPDGGLNIWDNSNIAESYGGVTTPLTFSFASHVYSEVYRQFCLIMAVPGEAIAASEQVFPRMLGLIRGRIYYNLLNWYRLLALFPGFTLNRSFMEQMMGVKEGIPDKILAEVLAGQRVGRLRDGVNLLRSLGGMLVNLVRLPSLSEGFYRRLDAALAPTGIPLGQLRADELLRHYRHLESQLLKHWDAPLVNDFFAMIFYGLLRKLVQEWCGEDSGLQNDLISGEGGIVSAEPVILIRQMARQAAGDTGLINLLCQGDTREIDCALADRPELKEQVGRYLERFGDRCLDELKLESITLHDDPLTLYRSVGEYAGYLTGGDARTPVDEGAIRIGAERKVAARLGGKPLRRFFFHWVLAQARSRVRDRENLRFERTRLFGRVRRIFLEIGRCLVADRLLEHQRDIFWLEKNEIFGFIDGTASLTDLKALVELRKREFGRWQECEAPDDRFETRGMVHHAQQYRSSQPVTPAAAGDEAVGIGCCPGHVTGRVRVIHNPKGATLVQGEILVAARTDPGWIMLFPPAGGILVERGSLLSHSAIVAREMGIPAIVAVSGLTGWLRTGDLVEMDGATGRIRKIEEHHDSQ